MTSDECIDFTSHFSFLGPPSDCKGFDLHVGPALARHSRKLNIRLTFGKGSEAVVYDLITFGIARAGTQEVEFVSSGNLPFKLSFVLRKDPNTVVDFKVDYKPVGAEVRAMKKLIAAMDCVGKDGVMEFFDLDQGKLLFTLVAGEQEIIDIDTKFRSLINDVALVADHYGVELIIPGKLTEDDRKALTLLLELARGTNREVNDIKMTVTKAIDLTPEIRKTLRGPAPFLIRQPEVLPRPVLFGVEVPTGVVLHHIAEAMLQNPRAYEARMAKAKVGQSLRISLIPNGPLRISALGKAGPTTGVS